MKEKKKILYTSGFDIFMLPGLNYDCVTILMQVIQKSRIRDFHRAGFGASLCVFVHVCFLLIRNLSFIFTNVTENIF